MSRDLPPHAVERLLAVGAPLVDELEAAVPVDRPVAPKGRVKPETLPAGEAVVAMHVGPYVELGRTHERTERYLADHGLEPRGACWEEYLTDPGMEPDPAKWRTRVVWPVQKAEEKDEKGRGGEQ